MKALTSNNTYHKVLEYREHCIAHLLGSQEVIDFDKEHYTSLFSKGKGEHLPCFSITKNKGNYTLDTGYFIGVDWVVEGKTAISIVPKLNKDNLQIDYIRMLFDALKHIDIAKEVEKIYQVNWEVKPIRIPQQQDMLTPFLVVEFLSLLKNIIKKGLKKSYYKVEQNLQNRVKGKVLASQSVKQNLMQNKPLYTYCTYEEFGLNNSENRLLKKTLTFVKCYLLNFDKSIHGSLKKTFNYIIPAFEQISEDINLNEIKQTKTNVFYKEYGEAINLAKLILKRFGYNISNVEKGEIIQTPPFWVDMTKLFEVYVYGLLKDRFYNAVKFQYIADRSNHLDYLLNSEEYQMVIDAKYKTAYQKERGKKEEDIRQVSGYARLKNVYEVLGKKRGEIIDCLIIYPDQEYGYSDLEKVNLKQVAIEQYYDVYKLPVKLPEVER